MKRFLFISILLLLALNWFSWKEVAETRALRVSFLDVGQGDAALIRTPEGHQILIDGGPGAKVLEKLGSELLPWDRTLDLVILTHPDADHLTGLVHVLEQYRADQVLWTGDQASSAAFLRWQELLQEQGNDVLGRAGQRILWSTGVMDVLHPTNLESTVNGNSLVIMLRVPDLSVLFTGDIERAEELRLLEEYDDLKADVLKAAHHGSKTSSARLFVEAVEPGIAVISAGRDNQYGHPHGRTIETFELYGITILRTDQIGDISITNHKP